MFISLFFISMMTIMIAINISNYLDTKNLEQKCTDKIIGTLITKDTKTNLIKYNYAGTRYEKIINNPVGSIIPNVSSIDIYVNPEDPEMIHIPNRYDGSEKIMFKIIMTMTMIIYFIMIV